MTLVPLTEENLEALADAAITDTDPHEVMPPVSGPPGWTGRRRAALLEFLRWRLRSAETGKETYVVTDDGRVIGFARLDPVGDHDLEAGYWLVRSRRGRGRGHELMRLLVDLAGARGADRLVAWTAVDNVASRRMLAAVGAELTVHRDRIDAVVRLNPPAE